MRYAALDRIERMEAGSAGLGVKLTTRSDDAYCPHWMGPAVRSGYPWTLALEAAFQLGAVVIAAGGVAEGSRIFLLWIEQARMERALPLGARLDFEARVLGRGEQVARFHCDVRADGVAVGSVCFALAIAASASTPAFTRGFAAYADYLTLGWRELKRTLDGEMAS